MKTRLFVACLLLSAFSKAQLKGRVIEARKDKKELGITGALVIAVNNRLVVETDTNGFFQFSKRLEQDTLIVKLIGYQSDTLLISGAESDITVRLKSDVQLNEVEVTYKTSGTELSMLSTAKLETLNERSLMKAACCNLSESFETNPSVDVSFSDAVSGAKQIQLLGLEGKYAQITKENMPYLRGLSNSYGLSFIPGTWIKSIQLGKGAGTVINGYESFTGQINTELQAPENMDRLLFNMYGNENGRNEYNLNLGHKFNEKVSTALLNHASFNPLAQDLNGDNFLDIPTGNQYNFTNKYNFFSGKGIEGQLGGNYLKDERRGGQIRKMTNDSTPLYLVNIDNEKWDIFGKCGYVFKRRVKTSMGLQASYLQHKQKNQFGLQHFHAEQKTMYFNYIFESYLFNTNHTYKLGASFLNDDINESYRLFRFARKETSAGVFAEYAFQYKEKFSLIAGVRADRHNFYGAFATPRLHLRFAPAEKTVFRLSGGRALRTANALMENTSLMVSSRDWILKTTDLKMPYGLTPEVAWNYGGNFTQKFTINYREAYVTLDVYRTDFTSQLVVDMENPREVNLYNLNGKSFSNTAQIEFMCEPRKRLLVRAAYRYVDTRTQYTSALLEKPFTARHRGYLNLAYETKNEQWQFDGTVQYNGSKRLPSTATNPAAYQMAERSPAFYNVLSQITYLAPLKKMKLDIYLGVENALNVKQNHPILSSEMPFGTFFDANIVWGPIYGRMLYAGLRWRIK
jgi:outer membrane receptor for ferrienterochelin and colicins